MKLPRKIKVDLHEGGNSEGKDLYNAICEFASDYITEKTGFCHDGFDIDIEITASNIIFDTSD